MLQAGLSQIDITPRVGVELCGFGPYRNRHSIAVRDRLYARGLALRLGATTLVLVSCDIIGVTAQVTAQVRQLVQKSIDLPDAAIMVHCTHTHSGPNTCQLYGWGDPDVPYRELLPHRLAAACLRAIADLAPATLSHAQVPCEHLALNREYDKDAPPLKEVLREDWRPAKPELTDTTCHVVSLHRQGRLAGFFSYFSCHPVVCCADTRYIHGDFCGLANSMLERERPGSVGLFLQGAQGDVNSCVVHKPEQESLLALDVLAARYARSVRHGLAEAKPLTIERLSCQLERVVFHRKPMDLARLHELLAEKQALFAQPGASDSDRALCMAAVNITALRSLIARLQAGDDMQPASDVQGFRIGPIALLASGFEMFQAIKRDVLAAAQAPIPLVMGITNDVLGYAPDKFVAQRGGYAADVVPMMVGQLPFANAHEELAQALLKLDSALAQAPQAATARKGF